MQSYRDHLDFGLISCRELVPDLWDLAGLFPEALEELEKLAPRSARSLGFCISAPRHRGARCRPQLRHATIHGHDVRYRMAGRGR